MTSGDIKKLLALRHEEDVFVTECHTGGNGQMRSMDAWAMKKSWAHPVTYGYEIKVSRSDFLGDEKWIEYLPYCHRFSFVCPHRLIQKEELPSEVGLIYVTKSGNRLITVRKACHRTAEGKHLNVVYKYIMMSRTKITASTMYMSEFDRNPKEWFERWLAEKEYNHEFGRIVGKNLRNVICEKIGAVDAENRALKRRMEDIEEQLHAIGLSNDTPQLLRKLKLMTREPITEMERCLEHVQRALSRVQSAVEELKGRTE